MYAVILTIQQLENKLAIALIRTDYVKGHFVKTTSNISSACLSCLTCLRKFLVTYLTA